MSDYEGDNLMLRIHSKGGQYTVARWLIWLLSWAMALALLALVCIYDFFRGIGRWIANVLWKQVEKAIRADKPPKGL